MSDDDIELDELVSTTASVPVRAVNKARKAGKSIVEGLLVPQNYFHLWASALTTGFSVFTIFTVSTLVRGLYGDSWIGSVSIGAIFGVMTLLASAFLKKGVMPIFDIVGIIINLSIFNMKARRRDNQSSIRAELHVIPAIILLITLLASGFASAGICRAVLGKTLYEDAAKVPNLAEFDEGKAFFIEYFAMTVFYVFAQQMQLVGVRIEFIAILSSFYWTALQAVGYDISSAAYNFVYWLTVNTVGFKAEFWIGWWIYLVAAVASAASTLVINKLIFWLYNGAIRFDTSQTKLATN